MAGNAIDVGEARAALANLPDGTSHGETPSPEHVYLPRSHLKAMAPDCLLVTGMRGAGKTFWWSALQDGDVRRLIGLAEERPPLHEHTEVRAGFGVKPAPDDHPGKDTLRELVNAGFEPRTVWRTIQAWHLARDEHPPHPLRQQDSWGTRTQYVAEHPEVIERLFQERDAEFERKGVCFLILFDGLDRCADDWKEASRAIRGLLQTAVEMRSYRKLRVKVFLRPDQADDDSGIADFPDAWKALSSKVGLSWPRHELYGLLWHHLVNGESGGIFRSFLLDGDWRGAQRERALRKLSGDFRRVLLDGDRPSVTDDGRSVFLVPRRLVVDEESQEEKFHGIAGWRMGRTPIYGEPYTWIQNRLSGAERRVGACSFLVALRLAADYTADQHPEHPKALHPDGIRRGVLEASKLRVGELEEEYPWMRPVMRSLAGMYVPCEFGEFAERWQTERVFDRLAEAIEPNEPRLPPRHLDDGPEGVRRDLESLGVFQPLYDGRLNIPSVFRVGYGLGLRGGVKPVR